MKHIIILAVAIIPMFFASSRCIDLEKLSDSYNYRLPDTFVPTFYFIALTIYPETETFTGSVYITFHLSNISFTTSDIYLHLDPDYIDISSIVLNSNVQCTLQSPNETQIATISCSEDVSRKHNILYIEYTARFSDDGYGLVKSQYKDEDEQQILIESNFKPTYARRAFPCMDEPDLDARFSLEISYPDTYTVISNSPSYGDSSSSTRDGIKVTKFEDTPEISTYSLSIFISKFNSQTITSEEDLEVKILTRAEVADYTSTIVGTYYSQILEQLGIYTGIPYQNLTDTGCYEVAVPDYSDATGDFGLFTYRETEFLDEGDKTTERAKQNIITAMVYKLGHEWYGGDVSTKWWSDIWANEAVATYLKYIVANKVVDDYELEMQFVVEVIQQALQHDAMPFAQALSSSEEEVNSNWDIQNKLDTVSYQKGASILHMINYMIRGEENFQSSLQYHLNQRRDSDTDGSDIISDLFDAQGDNYNDYYSYLETWVFSPGFPLLTVKLTNETDQVAEATLYQKRFIYPIENFTSANTKWCIPVSSATEGTQQFTGLTDVIDNPDEEMIYFYGADQWIIFNTLHSGFYRVNYDDTLWERIINTLMKYRNEIHVLNRAQIVDDVFNVARIGEVSYALAFQLSEFLVNETEYYPWYSALNSFLYLIGKLEDDEVEWNLKNYLLNLMENVIEIPDTDFSNDTHIDILKRVLVLEWACYLAQTDCINYATGLFKDFRDTQNDLEDYNYRGVIFCNGIRHSENINEDWEFLWQTYEKSISVHEKDDILKALGCAEDEDLLNSYLQKTITTDSGIKKQDVLVVFDSVFSSSKGLKAAMDFLETNVSDIQSFYKDMTILSKMIYAVAEKLLTDEQIDWLKNIISNDILDDYEDVKSKAIVLASVNNYWKKNYQKDVISLFPSTSTSTSTESISTTTDSKSEKIHVSQYIFVLVIILLINMYYI